MRLSERHERAQAQAETSTSLDRVAQTGMLVYGAVHLLVAWLVLRLALGDDSGSASGTGAFRTLAQTGTGRFLLLGVAIGFAALALWQAVEAVVGYRRERVRSRMANRLASGFKALLFAAIAVNAATTAAGSSGGNDGSDGWTARLMRLPSGPTLVAAVGLVIVSIGLFLTYYGLARRFRSMMRREGAAGGSGRTYLALGTIGYVGKGLAITLVGLLLGYAAVTHDPQKSGGLDQALHEVLHTPFGVPVLLAIALGLGCFGVFCIPLARHLDR
jgi:hypothetical protein